MGLFQRGKGPLRGFLPTVGIKRTGVVGVTSARSFERAEGKDVY